MTIPRALSEIVRRIDLSVNQLNPKELEYCIRGLLQAPDSVDRRVLVKLLAKLKATLVESPYNIEE